MTAFLHGVEQWTRRQYSFFHPHYLSLRPALLCRFWCPRCALLLYESPSSVASPCNHSLTRVPPRYIVVFVRRSRFSSATPLQNVVNYSRHRTLLYAANSPSSSQRLSKGFDRTKTGIDRELARWCVSTLDFPFGFFLATSSCGRFARRRSPFLLINRVIKVFVIHNAPVQILLSPLKRCRSTE